MMKKIGIIRRKIALLLIVALSINSFAAVVSDNDGSAFITKAEFDSLKNNFQSQIDTYNQSIDSKIDGAIASYLSGISVARTTTHKSLFDTLGIVNTGVKSFQVIGKNNKKWMYVTWASGYPFGNMETIPSVINYWTDIITYGSGFNSTQQAEPKGGQVAWQLINLRTGGNNANVSAEGYGVDVDAIRYGQRCFTVSFFTRRVTTGYNNWNGLIPIWNNPSVASPSITFNAPLPVRTGWQSSSNGFISSNFLTGNWNLVLRDGAGTGNYPAYTPPRVLTHNNGTVDTTNWSCMDPNHYYNSSGIDTGASGYSGYMLSSAAGDTFGDNELYFWPGGGTNKLFMMDLSDIGSNFKEYNLPSQPDGTPYMWGQWSELGLTASLASFKAQFDQDLRDLAQARGYTPMPYWYGGTPPADVKIALKGKLYEYDGENRRKELSTLRWAQASSQLGKDVLLGETPLIIHNAEKTGKITIDGGGLRLTFMKAAYDYKNSSKVYIAFTKQGAVNEVDTGTTAAPNWDVNNTIPFEYKNSATGGSWTTAPGNKFYQAPAGSSAWTNFRFDVEKGDDIYMHVVCEDFRDDQNIYVYAQSDTVCMLEAED